MKRVLFGLPVLAGLVSASMVFAQAPAPAVDPVQVEVVAPEAPAAKPAPAVQPAVQPAAPAPVQPAVVAPAQAQAAAPAMEAKPETAKFRFGGDIRVREEYREDIPPVPANPAPSQFNYFRFRTRVWGEYDLLENVAVRGRLCNEFRNWEDPDMSGVIDAKTYEWPDELVVDNLYLDAKNLLDNKLDLRIGRQDLMYGTGKIIADGTPADGSRTYYFNAVKASWKGIKNTTVDVLGMSQDSRDDFAINDVDRDVTGYSKAQGEVSESAAGFYAVNKSFSKVTIEAYDFYKEESDYTQAAAKNAAGEFVAPSKAWMNFDSANGIYEVPTLKLNTIGARLVPKFGSALDGNFEAAYQFGERGDEDASGYMLDASLTYRIPVAQDAWEPTVVATYYYLSGDDPATAKDEGWDPLFSRFPQYSELYVYSYDVGRWSNVSMPLATVTAKPLKSFATATILKSLKTTAAIGYITAPEKDGPGGGDVRGTLGVVKAQFDIAEGIVRKGLNKGEIKDKVTAHLWLETLEPGNYYVTDDRAYFGRWEIMYAF